MNSLSRRKLITGLTAFIAAPLLFARESAAKLRDGLVFTFHPTSTSRKSKIQIKGKTYTTYELYLNDKPVQAGDLVAGETYYLGMSGKMESGGPK